MISVVIPFFNEQENLDPLYEELASEFQAIKKDHEIVFVDDGSTDGSEQIVDTLAHKDKHVKLVKLRKRFGKGEALSRGVNHSSGEIIIFMDADLQDNPADITKFLKKIDEGYDLVNGVRTSRTHNSMIKTYSLLGNKFLKTFAHSPFTDINCGFKAFKREVLEETVLYANNFRFLPLDAFTQGFRVTEIPVDNRPRLHGTSKFGVGKAFIGLIDVITAYFLHQFSERPLHFFGMIGGIFFAIGGLITLELIMERVFFHVLLYRRPLFQLGMFLVIVGIQIIMTGILGELIVYLYKRRDK